MEFRKNIEGQERKKALIVVGLLVLVFIMFLVCLFVGSSRMTFGDTWRALRMKSSPAFNRIIWNIRIPRVLAALIAGAGLSVSGLIMQTNLNNSMASPSTLGVSNAAVFGANLSIIVGAGGFLSTGNNLSNFSVGMNIYAASFMAFCFSVISILFILGLCKIRAFSPSVVVLAGIAIGSVWTAATTILQFYATDVGLSAAIIWSFGDLGRATYKTDLIMLIVVLGGIVFFSFFAWKYNTCLAGDEAARSLGVNVDVLRFVSLLVASMITAVCVSFLGIIGFVGIICPHIVKRLMGQNHKFTIPASVLCGSLLLLVADTLSRSVGKGAALPVGAVTSLMGAPFFLCIIFSKKERGNV
ncbi:MAG: iron ABC transporter permease [Treponema sp.]|nr:iron ABC transporter permease [Treponema sp.]